MFKEFFEAHRILCIIGAVALVNALAFTVWRIGVDKSLTCVQHQTPRPNQPLNYLIAGNVAQPEQAFQFIADDLKGEVIYCNYQQHGWSAKHSAEEICLDIAQRVDKSNRQTVRVYTISCEDLVARYLEDLIVPYVDLEIVAINPQSSPRVLKPYTKWGLKIVAPLLEIVCHGTGFLSLIPFIPSTGSWHSPILLADQWMHIAYCEPPQKTDQTLGVVLSGQDAFLVNAEVSKYFCDTWKIEIDTPHAETKTYANMFASACERIVNHEHKIAKETP